MISRHKYLLAAILLSLFSLSVNGQHISRAMQFTSPVVPGDSSRFYFKYSNLAYFKNYEYFNNIQAGYTLFGVWQYPRLGYAPNRWLKIEAGALLQKDFGDKNFDRVLPTFSLQVQKKGYRFIFGALEGSQAHGLIEPLMQYDQVIERPLEEGVQLKIDKNRFQSDIWLDWQKRQQENANTPEQLASGLSATYTLTKNDKPLQVKIPLQGTIFHLGGQLDTTDIPEATIINYASGIWIEWNNPNKKSWLQQLRSDAYYSHFSSSEGNDLLVPAKTGKGWLANFYLLSKWNVSFLMSYWNGTNFYAPQGGKLYGSKSSRTTMPNYIEPCRELLFLNLLYEKEILPGLFTDIRFTPYFDLGNHLFEYSYQLFISYRYNFRLQVSKK